MKKIFLGMTALTIAFSAMAQTSDNARGKMKSRQNESQHRPIKGGENFDKLNLTDAQKAQLKTINEDFRQQMQALHNQAKTEDQKQKRQALVKEHKEKVAAILTPEQRKQAESAVKDFKDGGNRRGERFNDLTKDLNLTPDQSAKMASLNAALKTRLQEIRQNNLSPEEKKKQMKDLMKQHRTDMESLLTNDQKAQLKSKHKNRDRDAVK